MKLSLYKKLVYTLVLSFSILGSVEKSSCMWKSQQGNRSGTKKAPMHDEKGNMTKTVTKHHYCCACCCVFLSLIVVGVNLGFSVAWYYTQCKNPDTDF